MVHWGREPAGTEYAQRTCVCIASFPNKALYKRTLHNLNTGTRYKGGSTLFPFFHKFLSLKGSTFSFSTKLLPITKKVFSGGHILWNLDHTSNYECIIHSFCKIYLSFLSCKESKHLKKWLSCPFTWSLYMLHSLIYSLLRILKILWVMLFDTGT